MKITKVEIKNFKSIGDITIDVNKKGGSYTTMLLGINESGKSNILEAISLFDKGGTDLNYEDYHNYKNDSDDYIDLYYSLEFDNDKTCYNEFKKTIEGRGLVEFQVINIRKNVYISSENKIEECYEYDIKFLKKNIVFKKETVSKNENGVVKNIDQFDFKESKNIEDGYEKLTEENFCEIFGEKISSIIKRYEPSVSVWKPSDDKYSIGETDLTSFKDNNNSNVPLKNIFAIMGYKDKESIAKLINQIIESDKFRKKQSSIFSKGLSNYIKKIRNHKIKFEIEFTDSHKCKVFVIDEGKSNESEYFHISSRSEGFKHFVSLILSLSVETEKLGKNNRIILIDEPEVHLHPSGIRDLRDELLKIGKDNYVFIATHSPFIIDKNHIERNILVDKNESAITEIRQLNDENNILDDEVLSIAFGINVYKDLLLPKKLLVEGASDKVILDKILSTYGIKDCGITNAIGSKIVQIASMYNDMGISMNVLVDSDEEGLGYKEKIIKMGGVYNNNNVVSIKDLIGNIKDNATIEDILPKEYVESITKSFFEKYFKGDKDLPKVSLKNEKPFIEQIKIHYVKIKGSPFEKSDLNLLKKEISDNYKVTKKALKDNEFISTLARNLVGIISQ